MLPSSRSAHGPDVSPASASVRSQQSPGHVSPLSDASHTPSPQHAPGTWVCSHSPVAGSQLAVKQWFDPVQETGLAPVHTPETQESLCVQPLPSLQAVPFAAMGSLHCPLPGLHVPARWH
jgi:hypothetical protein